MKTFKLNDMKAGWFIGNFQPTAHESKDFEVAYKLHVKDEKWPIHFHKIATEINCLIRGKMTIQDTTFESGDIFIIEPNEIADPIFHEDCELIVVKVPSVLGDKYDI